MATVMVTGMTSLFTRETLERLAGENTVVLAGRGASYDGKVRRIHAYDTIPTEESFTQLFDVYSFDAVWYVSGYTDGGRGSFGESQMLEGALRDCAKSRVEKFILLSTGEAQNFTDQSDDSGALPYREYAASGALTAAQTEGLSRYFAEKTGMKVVTLWLPYVADRLNDTNFLGQVFRKASQQETVSFPYSRETRLDILSASDLTDLLLQITGETDDANGSYYAVSGYRHTYGDLEDALREAVPDLTVSYEDLPNDIHWPAYPTELRRRYGFIPMNDVVESVGEYYGYFLREVQTKNESLFRRFLRKLGTGAFKYLELILVFLLTELIARYTSDSVYFRFVDVRLAFIVIMGVAHGMRTGILAAVLESIVLVLQYISIGMSGALLFYNIENWIPFAIYLIAGSIPGYIRDKSAEDLKFSKKEYDLLHSKYLFLHRAYCGAIENKGEFKRQILGFKDSFGKIFNAVQKLDNELPQSVFLKGLQVIEDILENRNVAIYTVDSWQRFGRMVVCSGALRSRLPVSIPLADHADMFAEVKAGRVWRNVDLLPEAPMYACGVFRNEAVVLMVVLWDASSEQYGTRYTNIFQILCGLVQTSFLRALEYEQLRHDQMTVPGTRAVTPERLDQLLAVQEEMRQAGTAEYMLLRFEDRDPARVSDLLASIVRASDTVGQGSDGCMYLLLTQVTEQNFQFVGKRIGEKGLAYQIVEKVGA